MSKFTLVKTVVVTAAAALALAMPLETASAAEEPGVGKTIHMARKTWDTGWPKAEIYRQLETSDHRCNEFDDTVMKIAGA